MNVWWTPQEAGLFGGIAGSAVGIAGGLLGTLAGIFAPRGKARKLIYTLWGLVWLAGVVSLSAGVYAKVVGQPYHVWYPLVLMGGLLTVLLAALFPVVRLRYRQAELRRLEAEELRRQ